MFQNREGQFLKRKTLSVNVTEIAIPALELMDNVSYIYQARKNLTGDKEKDKPFQQIINKYGSTVEKWSDALYRKTVAELRKSKLTKEDKESIEIIEMVRKMKWGEYDIFVLCDAIQEYYNLLVKHQVISVGESEWEKTNKASYYNS